MKKCYLNETNNLAVVLTKEKENRKSFSKVKTNELQLNENRDSKSITDTLATLIQSSITNEKVPREKAVAKASNVPFYGLKCFYLHH